MSASASASSSAPAAAAGGAASAPAAAAASPVVEVKDLNFTYGAAAGFKVVLHDMSFSLPRGSRTLLVGDNGAGKSTLLRLLAGKHIHAPGVVRVLGRESYFDTSLNLLRAYLATDWGRKTVAFSGVSSMSVDIAVREMMADTQAQFLPRRAQLVELLGVDLDWRMHQLSDGQRRRVQIMLQMLRPVEVLLLDEITTDLDLITRQDFLNHLKFEAEAGGAAIVYATHIFDGLDEWPTHIAYVGEGRLLKFGRVEEFADLQEKFKAGTVAPLLRTIESWLRADRERRRAAGAKMTETAGALEESNLGEVAGNGYLSGRFNSGYGN